MSELNVYQKLAQARQKLKESGLKQSGKNKGVGYSYFDLQDILPQTTKIEKELGLLSVISFTADEGILTLYNADKPEEHIEFHSPIRDAELRGCHPVQNLGAVETYVRRYLYLLAYEIVETEALDLTQGKDVSASKPQKPAEPESKPKESYKCAVCGKEISKKIFDYSMEKYGTPLCSQECRDFVERAEKMGG